MIRTLKKLYHVGVDWGWFISEVKSCVKPGDKLLDAGAGECKWAEHFPECEYIGLDYKVGDVRWDFSKVLLEADLNKNIPLPDNSIDGIISIQVLEHLSNPQQALNEMARVLKPGAHLFFTTPFSYQEHQAPFDFYRYTRYGLRHLVEQAGLTVVYIQPMGGYFMLLREKLMYAANPQYYAPNLFCCPLQRVLFWPLFLLVKVFTLGILPPVFYLLDKLDTEQIFTLGHTVHAQKPE